MGSATTPAPGTRRSRCARWCGWDHNPLRRPADRIEAGLRLAVLIGVLTVVPVLTFMAGRTADHVFARQARAQQAADHQVSAVLTQAAPTNGTIDPYGASETTWVPARWTAPDGAARSGQVLVPAGAHKGSTTPIWVTASGTLTEQPFGYKDVIADVCVTVTVTGLVLTVVLLSGLALARRVLDQRRFSAWEAEWRATGPLWTGHRS